MHTTVLNCNYYDVRTCFFNRRTTGQHSANYVSRQFLWLAGNSRYSCLSLVRLACGTASYALLNGPMWSGRGRWEEPHIIKYSYAKIQFTKVREIWNYNVNTV